MSPEVQRARTKPVCDEACSHCFYCDTPIASKHDHDHFPIPFRHGGSDTVACCTNCHSLKDRLALNDWPIADLFQGFHEMPPRARLLTAKVYSLLLDFRADQEDVAA